MLHESKNRVIVFYVILPVLLVSLALPVVMLPGYTNNSQKHRNFPTLGLMRPNYAATVGLMSPNSKAEIHYVHQAVNEVIATYNDYYGDYYGPTYNWPIDRIIAIDASATVAMLKTMLKYADRVHIAGHGSYSYSTGPKITLYDTFLTANMIKNWKKIDGSCLLVYLSACYSLGRGNGDVDDALVTAIKDRTNVRMVIGYSGEVDVIGATLLAIYFWWEHIAGLRYYYYGGSFWPAHSYGGYSGAASFSRARYFLEDLIEDLKTTAVFTVSGIVGVIVGYFVGPLEGALSALVSSEIEEMLGNTITAAVFGSWVQACEDALNAFIKIDDREYVPSLTPVSGSGGSGDLYYTVD